MSYMLSRNGETGRVAGGEEVVVVRALSPPQLRRCWRGAQFCNRS